MEILQFQKDLGSLDIIAQENKLWSYIILKTMTPYPDDYWFHQGEPYFIKSLTFAPKGKQLKSKRIEVTAGQFPIYSSDKECPLCKIKSDQNLTLEAEGEPNSI